MTSTFGLNMGKVTKPSFYLKRQTSKLPLEADFFFRAGGLEAGSAWKNFGELSLMQAYRVFVENPDCYQEDFMYMGPKAFQYYFPVIDKYVREVVGNSEGHDCSVAILGSGIEAQCNDGTFRMNESFNSEVSELCEYVLSHLSQYSPAAKDQRRVERTWSRVLTALRSTDGPNKTRHSSPDRSESK